MRAEVTLIREDTNRRYSRRDQKVLLQVCGLATQKKEATRGEGSY